MNEAELEEHNRKRKIVDDTLSKISDNELLDLLDKTKDREHPIILHPLVKELVKRFKDKNSKIETAIQTFKELNIIADEIIKESI